METKTREAVNLETGELTDTKVIETRPADITDLAPIDVFFDNPKADAVAISQREARRKSMMRMCFQMTSSSQWVKFVDKSTGKTTVYPMGGAADAILRQVFGCTWQDKEVVVETDNQGEPVRAEASGWLCLTTGRRIEKFTGFREMGGFVKTKPDLIKGALENMKSVAVRDTLGLRGRSPEELAALGLDLTKVSAAEFANNKQGASAVATFPWGNLKGKGLNDPEVKEKDLNWLIKAMDEALADKDKAKYHKANEKLRAAALAELERRKAPAAPAPAPTAADDYPPEELAAAKRNLSDEEPGSRG